MGQTQVGQNKNEQPIKVTGFCMPINLRIFSTIAFLVFALVSANGFAADNTSQWIRVDELNSVLQERNIVIVDLRTPGEFIKGHLAGSINVPVQDLIRKPSLLDRFQNRPILLYCRTVNRTSHALSILEHRDFQMIYALDGGYEVLKKQYLGREKEGGRP